MKRVFIIHGWAGWPEEAWFPWLKVELENKGFVVSVPAMPDAAAPKMESWIPFLAQLVGKADSQTFFVGHSIGCQTIIRYLETLPANIKIGGCVFVAGWYDLRNLDTEEEKRIAGPWVKTPRNDAKIKNILSDKAIAIFSDDDPWVDSKNIIDWQVKAGAQTLLLRGQGHFNEESGIKELPEALKAVLELATPRTISLGDFAKLDIRMGKVLAAERIPNADKLLKLTIDTGEGSPRTICSGIAQFYKPEELIGKLVPVLANLAPRRMKGIESQGMVLMASDTADGGRTPVLLLPMKALPPGSPVQ